MPTLDEHLHYRMIDVSSIKELCRRWYPRIYFGQPPKEMTHRALADITESIRELAYYRGTAFVPPPGPNSDQVQAVADARSPAGTEARRRKPVDGSRAAAGAAPRNRLDFLGPRAARPCGSAQGMVGVAQLVELRLVVPVVAGSSPVAHPPPSGPRPFVGGPTDGGRFGGQGSRALASPHAFPDISPCRTCRPTGSPRSVVHAHGRPHLVESAGCRRHCPRRAVVEHPVQVIGIVEQLGSTVADPAQGLVDHLDGQLLQAGRAGVTEFLRHRLRWPSGQGADDGQQVGDLRSGRGSKVMCRWPSERAPRITALVSSSVAPSRIALPRVLDIFAPSIPWTAGVADNSAFGSVKTCAVVIVEPPRDHPRQLHVRQLIPPHRDQIAL